MAGAGADPRRLAEIGDEFATEAPDLAARAYEAAFRYRPDAAALQGWLLGLARGGQQDALVATARAGIAALPQGDAGTASAREEALARLERDAGTAGAEEAIARLVALVAAPPDAQGRRP